jgi:poly(A) polymerase
MRLATLKKMLAEEGFEELCRVARLDALASSRDLRYVLFCERRRAGLRAEELQPPRLLTGADLLTMGYAAGPRIGEILRMLEDAQLEGEVTSRAAAETFVRERFPLAS